MGTVMPELEWVLRSRYRFDKATVLQAFNALLETQELEFQTEAALERALHLYRQGAAEFADCLHAGLCTVRCLHGDAPSVEHSRRRSDGDMRSGSLDLR